MPSSRETVSKLLTPVSQEIITPKLLTLGITEQTLPLIGQKTQEIMPPLGIGTYKLKGQECETMLTKALVMGYSSIDTAALYKRVDEKDRVCLLVVKLLMMHSSVSSLMLEENGRVNLKRSH
jgi:hypothetical protein